MLLRQIISLTGAILALCSIQCMADDLFTAEVIPTSYGSYTGFTPNGIDNNGKLYGSVVSSSGQVRPAVKNGGVFWALSIPAPYTSSSGFTAVSSSGAALAQVWQSSTNQHVAAYENGIFSVRSLPYGIQQVFGRAITSGGRIAGTAYQAPGVPYFYFDGWGLNQTQSTALAVNDLGDVVGTVYQNGQQRAAILYNGGYALLDSSVPAGVGGSALIATNKKRLYLAGREMGNGILRIYGQNAGHGFQLVGDTVGYASFAPKVILNECGTAAGSLNSPSNGFVWKPSTGTINLNNVTRNLSATISSIIALNDRGQMIGRLSNGGNVLVTPLSKLAWNCLPDAPVAID